MKNLLSVIFPFTNFFIQKCFTIVCDRKSGIFMWERIYKALNQAEIFVHNWIYTPLKCRLSSPNSSNAATTPKEKNIRCLNTDPESFMMQSSGVSWKSSIRFSVTKANFGSSLAYGYNTMKDTEISSLCLSMMRWCSKCWSFSLRMARYGMDVKQLRGAINSKARPLSVGVWC